MEEQEDGTDDETAQNVLGPAGQFTEGPLGRFAGLFPEAGEFTDSREFSDFCRVFPGLFLFLLLLFGISGFRVGRGRLAADGASGGPAAADSAHHGTAGAARGL
jgi:hypothetical protein